VTEAIQGPSADADGDIGYLARFERQVVIDMTELIGPFRVDLQWTPDTLRNRVSQDGAAPSINGQPVSVDGPSVPTALQEQLGLRLESRKGPRACGRSR